MQLTFRDIEKAFEIDEKTLYHWLNAKALPTVKANDQYYFNSVEVLEWALKCQIPLTRGAVNLCEKNRPGLDIFSPALTRGGVHYYVPGHSREEVLQNVLERLPLPGHIQKDALRELLLSREQTGTTAVGQGIAIPHVKHPMILAGMEPVAGLFFLENNIDFLALDGQPVHTLFLIMSSSFKGHLSLLSRLAFCLQDETVKSVLTRRGSTDEVLLAFQVAESKTTRIS